MDKLRNPAQVLFFLAPGIGELLSGSAPPLQFFNPVSFLLLTILYGGSALLIRELCFRWGKGWLSILMMGLAFGILNEGIIAKSFFDPHWKDLGPLAEYGRAWGVNWVWTVQLMIYHSVISITIPILLTNLLFPTHRKQRWLSNRAFTIVFLALALNTLFGFAVINTYQPNPAAFIPFVLIMFFLIGTAKFLPAQLYSSVNQITKPAKWFFLLGFLFNLFLFFMTDGLAQNRVNPLMTILIIIGINCLFGWVFLKLSERAYLGTRQQWGFAAGVLSLFILLSFVHELLGGKIGMSVIGILFGIFLFWMYRRLKKTVVAVE